MQLLKLQLATSWAYAAVLYYKSHFHMVPWLLGSTSPPGILFVLEQGGQETHSPCVILRVDSIIRWLGWCSASILTLFLA